MINSAGCSFAQRQDRQRNPCLFARRNYTHAERAARTGRNDRRGRGFYWRTKRRTTWFLWENYDGEQVLISRSFWRGRLLEPKTRLAKTSAPPRALMPKPGLTWLLAKVAVKVQEYGLIVLGPVTTVGRGTSGLPWPRSNFQNCRFAQFDHLPGWLPCVGGIPEGGTGRGDPPLPSPASGPAIIRGLDPVHKWKSEL